MERCLQLGYERSFRVENKEGDFKKHGVELRTLSHLTSYGV